MSDDYEVYMVEHDYDEVPVVIYGPRVDNWQWFCEELATEVDEEIAKHPDLYYGSPYYDIGTALAVILEKQGYKRVKYNTEGNTCMIKPIVDKMHRYKDKLDSLPF